MYGKDIERTDDSHNIPVNSTTSKAEMAIARSCLARQLYSLINIDPRTIRLPGKKWTYVKTDDLTMVFCELISESDSSALRIRKHVEMNLRNGICASYVMQHMICVMNAVGKITIENSIIELHMMDICVGGPPASKFVPTDGGNCHVDGIGNWRHNACKIITNWADMICVECEPLQFRLIMSECVIEKGPLWLKMVSTGKKVILADFTQQRPNRLKALRKRLNDLYRKNKEAPGELRRSTLPIEDVWRC